VAHGVQVDIDEDPSQVPQDGAKQSSRRWGWAVQRLFAGK
jgi:hypothetical protein